MNSCPMYSRTRTLRIHSDNLRLSEEITIPPYLAINPFSERSRSALVFMGATLLPLCPPRGLPVEHRCGQTDGGGQEHQGVTHEMDQHEPDTHDFPPPLSQEGWSR